MINLKGFFRLKRNNLRLDIPSSFKHIHLLDTAVSSDNVGDEIIVEACKSFINEALGDCYITTSSSHDGAGRYGEELIKSADFVLLLGTNALSATSFLEKGAILKLSRKIINLLENKVLLFGVGANRDFLTIDNRQKEILCKVLTKNLIHSVRDKTAIKLLEECGIQNVMNTSCPTLWEYSGINTFQKKSESVVFTLTRHKKNKADADLIKILKREYKKIYFWPQQPRDYLYLLELGEEEGVEVIPPNLCSYDFLLESVQPDVIGTRLHGTIRGLQKGCRTICISIDNRARDVSDDTGLVALSRQNESFKDELSNLINNCFNQKITLPMEKIDFFRGQLRSIL